MSRQNNHVSPAPVTQKFAVDTCLLPYAPNSYIRYGKGSAYTTPWPQDLCEYLMARLAEEVVHEIGNHLCAVKGFLALSRDQGCSYHHLIMGEVDQIEASLKNFSIMAGNQYEIRERIDLREVVCQTLDEFYPRYTSSHIWVTLTTGRAKLPVLVNRERLQIAIRHLLSNANEACHPGQVVEIKVSREGRYAALSVLNPITPSQRETLRYALLPFFTTKEGHPGLGLNLVHRISANYGGKLKIEDRKPDSFVATLHLPLAIP